MGANILFRIGGLICLAAALAFGWFFIWEPLQQARAGAPEVEYSIKAFVFVPFAAVFGLFFVLFGDSVAYRNVEKQTPTLAGWVLFLIAGGASAVSFWWFQAQFDALGYAAPGQYPSGQPLTPMPSFSAPALPKQPG
jgi:hypothetical protein